MSTARQSSSPNDTTPLLSKYHGDDEMMELVELFVEEMSERVELMSKYWESENYEELKRLSHQLKGASAGYGFPQVGSAAAELEALLKSEVTDPKALEEPFKGLISICNRVSL